MRGSAETVSGVGSGATVASSGVVTAWAPTSLDDAVGGPGSVNPLLTVDGECAIDVEWPVEFGTGSQAGVLASENVAGVRSVRKMDDIGGLTPALARTVRLDFLSASGADVELLRRAIVHTRSGCAPTRARIPRMDEVTGSVATAPRCRVMPRTIRITRDAAGITARVEGVELERLE